MGFLNVSPELCLCKWKHKGVLAFCQQRLVAVRFSKIKKEEKYIKTDRGDKFNRESSVWDEPET